MQQSNVDKLEKYRFVLNNRSFTPGGGYDLNEVVEVIRAEFNPNYHVNMYCDSCKMEMVRYAFNEMDKRLKQ